MVPEPGVHAARIIPGSGASDRALGPPVPAQDHCRCACGFGHARAVEQLNQEHRARLAGNWRCIGLNTGLMCVGDMGSNIQLRLHRHRRCGQPGFAPRRAVQDLRRLSSPVNLPAAYGTRLRVEYWIVCASKAKPGCEHLHALGRPDQASALNADNWPAGSKCLHTTGPKTGHQCGQSLAVYAPAPQSVLYALYASRLEE